MGYGQEALLSILSHLVFIAVTWWALQSINFEKFLRKNRVAQARMLYVLVSIVIGSIVSEFFPRLPILVQTTAINISVKMWKT